MKDYQSLSHTRWDCKYHVVFIPKRRKKRVFGVLRRHLGEVFHELASHKESKIVEGHLMGDHVHICISIPPKYAVSNVVGYLKGKSAIQIARKFGGRQKNFTGEHFWARGYFVSTVGLDENIVRAYIRNQEEEDEAAGKILGRPKVSAEVEAKVRALHANGVGKVRFAKQLRIGVSVVQRIIRHAQD